MHHAALPPGRAQRWDDCDPDVRAFVERVVAALRAQLGDALAGVYLHGSLATGCYRRTTSDVDLLVIARGRLGETVRRRTSLALLALSDTRPTTGDLELSIIQERHARDFTHPLPFELHFGENWADRIRRDDVDYAAERRDRDLAAHCTVARARGVALLGPPPAEMFAPVPWPDFLDAVLDDFAWIVEGDHILESPLYAVLNACRVLQLLTAGERTIANKEEGALWALAHLPSAHRPLVRRALDCYRSAAPVTPAQRRMGGLAWDPAALRDFRDFAARRARELAAAGR